MVQLGMKNSRVPKKRQGRNRAKVVSPLKLPLKRETTIGFGEAHDLRIFETHHTSSDPCPKIKVKKYNNFLHPKSVSVSLR